MRGRTFTDRDRDGAPLVAIIDEAFAKRYFPGEDPIGRGIDIGNGSDGFAEIVGVVGSVRYDGLGERAAADDFYAAGAGRIRQHVGGGADDRRSG